jgi:hypothetical protein
MRGLSIVNVRFVIRALMESAIYLTLTLTDRRALVKRIYYQTTTM